MQDADHLMREAEFMAKELPQMETDCQMQGQCKKDFDALEGMVTRLESVIKQGDWKKTDEALKILFQSFGAASQDCHSKMFDDLIGLSDDDQC